MLGPKIRAFTLAQSAGAQEGTCEPLILGRLEDCQLRLPEAEKTVSRRHCRFELRPDGWHVTDLGSRHGTFLNEIQLVPEEANKLRLGDTLRIGPWTFRLGGNDSRAMGMPTMDDTRQSGGQLVTVPKPRQDAIDRRRLELLIKCAKQIQLATDELRLAETVLDAILEGTGYPRAAIIRPSVDNSHERIDVLSTRMSQASNASFQFSRSLIAAACTGQMVQLRRDDGEIPPMSILSMGTVHAMAVPILLDSRAALCIYLDARRDEPPVHDDAAAFCQAIAEMCSLSISGMQRARLEAERLRLTEQMDAAMLIQRQIIPAPRGELPRFSYAMELRPGRFVAGDLFDVLPLDEHRVAFFIGDVAGKGLPAAILMATTQSYLNCALRHHADPASAVCEVNRHLVLHCPESKFVSLWVGVLDTRTGVLRYVDAGHGYWLVRAPGRMAAQPPVGHGGGAPLRVEEDFQYTSDEITLVPGTRLVLFSDGLVEQHNAAGDLFGLERLTAALDHTDSVESDVAALVRAVHVFAGADILADDLTVGSLEFRA